jgi:hypothetical protein
MSSLCQTKEFYNNYVIDQVIKELGNDHDLANGLSSQATEYLEKTWKEKLEQSGVYTTPINEFIPHGHYGKLPQSVMPYHQGPYMNNASMVQLNVKFIDDKISGQHPGMMNQYANNNTINVKHEAIFQDNPYQVMAAAAKPSQQQMMKQAYPTNLMMNPKMQMHPNFSNIMKQNDQNEHLRKQQLQDEYKSKSIVAPAIPTSISPPPQVSKPQTPVIQSNNNQENTPQHLKIVSSPIHPIEQTKPPQPPNNHPAFTVKIEEPHLEKQFSYDDVKRELSSKHSNGNGQDVDEDENAKYFEAFDDEPQDQETQVKLERYSSRNEESKQETEPNTNLTQSNLSTQPIQDEDSGANLNSDDDPVELDLPDPEDAMFACHEKHSRHGSKWKVTLKQCILNVKGKEYILSQANGEFEFQ